MVHVTAVLEARKTAELIDSPTIHADSPIGIVLRTQMDTDAGSASGFSSYVDRDAK